MTITNLPPAPTRNDSPEVFSSKADASLGALPTFVTEANATVSQVESDKLAAAASSSQASLYTTEAINSAQLSAANANYKGLWSAQTGAANIPYSVFHEGDFWVLVSNIANVTTSEPSDSNSDWRIAEAVPEIRVPSAVQPLSGSTGVSIAPTLEASAYSPLYSVDARLHRRFEVTLAADTSFASPVFTSEVDANSVVVSPALALETAHIWRCKDVTELPDSSLLESEWMATQDFTTAGIVINAPTLTVEGSPTSVPESPTLTAGAFDTTPTGQDTHASTDWEVRVTATSALVYTSAADAVNLTSIVVPEGILDPNTQFTFRVRYNGTTYGSSTFTEVVATTLETFEIVPLLAVTNGTSPFVTIYNQEIDTFTKLPDPATLPVGASVGVAFSSDDLYMAVAHNTTPFITIYKRSGDTFTKLADPAVLPTGVGNGVAFSSDDTYLAIAHSTTPFITIYKRSGDTFTKLADPASLPTSNGIGIAFSSDNTYLATTQGTSPFINIYKRSGDTFTKLANPSVLPTGVSFGVAFGSADTYLAVAHSGTSPFVTIYKRSGDTFTKLANPASLPTNAGRGVAFSNDGTYMVQQQITTPFINIYKRSGDTFTRLADPAVLPSGSGLLSVAFSGDDTYLAIAHSTTPFITIYKRSGDTFTKLADPATLPAGAGFGVAFSNTGFPQ